VSAPAEWFNEEQVDRECDDRQDDDGGTDGEAQSFGQQ
jgi:hypothetical protein